MMYDLLAMEVGKERYNDLLRESEDERLAMAVMGRQSDLSDRIRQTVGLGVQIVVNRMAKALGRVARTVRPLRRSRARHVRMIR